MKIGILITGHVAEALQAEHGNYDLMFQQFLAGHGFSFEAWYVVDGQFPRSPSEADGWLITGSKHGVYEDHAWIDPLERLIRAIVADHLPLVGICFGHQIIAQALGGHVEKFDGGWSVGRTTYQGERGPYILNAWHQDQVITPPDGARVLASSDFCKYAMLAIGDHVLTVQPHPEFSPAYTADLARVRGPGVVPDALLERALLDIDGPNDNAVLAAEIAKHFNTARVPA